MTRSKVKVTRPLKLEILQFTKSISSAIFNASWQMTTDAKITDRTIPKFCTEQIDICPSFCVTWLRTWNGVTLIVVYLLKEHANTGFRFWQLFDRYRKYVGAGVDRSPVRGYFLFVFVIFHVLHCIDYLYYECIFRSTPKSRPNNMGQMSVRTSVRPSTKSFFRFRWNLVCR